MGTDCEILRRDGRLKVQARQRQVKSICHRGHRGHREMPDQITERIIGAAVEVHRHLGPGLLESIYEQALAHELMLRAVKIERQVPVEVIYKDIRIQGQRLDLLVEGQVIVELKSIKVLPEVVSSQVLSYLKATGLKRALLVNFGEVKLVNGIRRFSL
jgi:GxxExxY protein